MEHENSEAIAEIKQEVDITNQETISQIDDTAPFEKPQPNDLETIDEVVEVSSQSFSSEGVCTSPNTWKAIFELRYDGPEEPDELVTYVEFHDDGGGPDKDSQEYADSNHDTVYSLTSSNGETTTLTIPDLPEVARLDWARVDESGDTSILETLDSSNVDFSKCLSGEDEEEPEQDQGDAEPESKSESHTLDSAPLEPTESKEELVEEEEDEDEIAEAELPAEPENATEETHEETIAEVQTIPRLPETGPQDVGSLALIGALAIFAGYSAVRRTSKYS